MFCFKKKRTKNAPPMNSSVNRWIVAGLMGTFHWWSGGGIRSFRRASRKSGRARKFLVNPSQPCRLKKGELEVRSFVLPWRGDSIDVWTDVHHDPKKLLNSEIASKRGVLRDWGNICGLLLNLKSFTRQIGIDFHTKTLGSNHDSSSTPRCPSSKAFWWLHQTSAGVCLLLFIVGCWFTCVSLVLI